MDGVEEVIEPEEHRRLRLVAQAETYRNKVAHLRALRDETAGELCTHGVKASNCLDHLRRTEETEPETDQPEEGEHA